MGERRGAGGVTSAAPLRGQGRRGVKIAVLMTVGDYATGVSSMASSAALGAGLSIYACAFNATI